MGVDMTAVHDETEWYRLNWAGMTRCIEDLWRVGIVVEAQSPPWPEPIEYGLIEWPDEDDPLTENDRAFLAAVDVVLAMPLPGDVAGIPSYKFATNDGWIVGRGEIIVAIGWADHRHPGWRTTVSDETLRFVGWMEAATKGFRVT